MAIRRLYVDSNIFFYAKILDRKYGPACRSVLEDINDKRIGAVVSVLVYLEVGNALRKYGLADEVEPVIGALASLSMDVHRLDVAIISEAVQIHSATGISIYDCAHAATMKQAQVTEIISADRDFDRIPWVKRMDPLEYTQG